MKVLITGSGGLLGQKLVSRGRREVRIFSTARTGPGRVQGDFELLDVTDAQQIKALLGRLRPDWVIHTAALTDVDRCEMERDLAWRTNAGGTENIVRACEVLRIGLVSLSTDYVFDGTAGPYSEADPTNPLSTYGLTKLEGERRVLSMRGQGIVVRTVVLFGHARGVRPNFVTWLIRTLRGGAAVRVVTDQWGTPTLADDLADFLIDLCPRNVAGLFHFAGADLLSRYEMALRVCRRFGLDEGLVIPTTTQELRQVAPRPLRSGLKTDLIQRQFQVRPRPFDEALNVLAEQIGDLKALD
ncbi:MAG: dTDP-4-dehydrorhamnose reductase [Candidatus Handelsmanbacteria bacterium RIFCSPLOWO2_12_FULL_64_10]|uniref:dTDP-4-dehydrorhamnose reductase n=1 Tax=Handelsmanbacteria sp. (strain RIFCSPLOWO2_12_FULL_64_10) TaxID=1817868 RepID=A0A1F6CKR9_HANXR|nr:MAG: dTDP-4-dehydrorhamnose reductase [Candidatus Handelsmanbacteria bacterium RIFCSPLOWO2_12_FULL_64_10]